MSCSLLLFHHDNEIYLQRRFNGEQVKMVINKTILLNLLEDGTKILRQIEEEIKRKDNELWESLQ